MRLTASCVKSPHDIWLQTQTASSQAEATVTGAAHTRGGFAGYLCPQRRYPRSFKWNRAPPLLSYQQHTHLWTSSLLTALLSVKASHEMMENFLNIPTDNTDLWMSTEVFLFVHIRDSYWGVKWCHARIISTSQPSSGSRTAVRCSGLSFIKGITF